jgi:hypothetical protein
MPIFTITEKVHCTQVITYEVEAKNEAEALNKVLNNEAERVQTVVSNHDYEKAQYDIELTEE